MALIGKNIEFAAGLLRQNQLVAIPTETVYGLAGNALSEKAVASIFEAKQRPFFDPLILHVGAIQQVASYASWHDERLKRLAEAIWPGPLTVLLPKKSTIPDLVTAGSELVALRIPDQTLTLELLKTLDFPLAAPSANPFGYISPTNAYHVDKQLGAKISYILNGGECRVGLESTIVGVEQEALCVYRLGGLAVADIEQIAGPVTLMLNLSGDPKAPGQLKSHYAPRKKLYLVNEGLAIAEPGTVMGYLGFGTEHEAIQRVPHITYNLSVSGDLKEASANLFKYLRLLDESEARYIVTDYLPNEGLGMAINDRLRRAMAH